MISRRRFTRKFVAERCRSARFFTQNVIARSRRRRGNLYGNGCVAIPKEIAALATLARNDIYANVMVGWCVFFLTALTEQAKENETKAKAILDLYQEKKDWIIDRTRSQFGVRALDWFFSQPIFKSSDFVALADIPESTAGRISRIVRAEGMLRELRPASGNRSALLAFPELLNLAEGRRVF